jgi:hypothetical protein
MTDEQVRRTEICDHIAQVKAWLDENVRMLPTPLAVTLSAFAVDWNTLAGSFTPRARRRGAGRSVPVRHGDHRLAAIPHADVPLAARGAGELPAYEFTPDSRRHSMHAWSTTPSSRR